MEIGQRGVTGVPVMQHVEGVGKVDHTLATTPPQHMGDLNVLGILRIGGVVMITYVPSMGNGHYGMAGVPVMQHVAGVCKLDRALARTLINHMVDLIVLGILQKSGLAKITHAQ